MEGESLRPILEGKEREGHAALFWEHEGQRAIRMGPWKLVALKGKPWALYDMSEDRGEMHDLASQHPEKVQELSARWEQWAKRTHVWPAPGGAKK